MNGIVPPSPNVRGPAGRTPPSRPRRARPPATAPAAAPPSRVRWSRARSAPPPRTAGRRSSAASIARAAACSSHVGGRRKLSVSAGPRAQHVAGPIGRREAVGADVAQRRAPRLGEELFGRVGRHRLGAAGERELLCRRDVDRRRRCLRPRATRSAGISTCSSGSRISPVALSSMRSSSWRAMRKLDGTTPLACPEWAPAVSTSTVSTPFDEAAQRRRHPQPLVVEAAAVEADDELGLADAVGERLDVGRQVRAAALLAGLDEHDAGGRGRCPRPGRTRWRRARRTRRSRRRPRPARTAGRPRSPASTARARRASRPSRAACRGARRAARCDRPAPASVAGTSHTTSGVRPGRRWTSTVRPSIGRAAHQSRIITTACSM